MKKIISLLIFAFVLLQTGSLWADVAMKLELDRKRYLEYEAVYAKLIMRNDSGHVLAFGVNKALHGSISFEISDQLHNVIKMRKNRNLDIVGTIIKPGETKQIIINITNYYQTMPAGEYSIIAYISHAQLPQQYQSNRVYFSITKGHTIWSQTVGVPNLLHPGKRIRSRSYKLKTMFDGNDEIVFLSVEDQRMIYAIHKLGYAVRENPPQCEIDLLSRLHLILPASAKIFNYFVFNVDGKLEKHEVYRRSDTIPMLIRNQKNGTVIIAGGVRARKNLDYNEE